MKPIHRYLVILLVFALACITDALRMATINVASPLSRRSTLCATSNPEIPKDTVVRIGTRGSPLALAQAHMTKSLLEKHFEPLRAPGSIVIHEIMTKGDSILNQALSEIGGKGLFTKELDVALYNNEVDICVHSMKDVPTILPEWSVLPCMLEREVTHDVFISKDYNSLQELPDGAVIGTASLRRQAQLLAMNPKWKVVNFRGNLQSRLSKVDKKVVDATLLAAAGIRRMGLDSIKKLDIPESVMLPAVAQGAIGIQCRANDKVILDILSVLNHPSTTRCVECERGFLSQLDGNCRTPIAAQAREQPDGSLHLRGMIAMADGSDIDFIDFNSSNDGSMQPWDIGKQAGQQLIDRLGAKYDTYKSSYNTKQKTLETL